MPGMLCTCARVLFGGDNRTPFRGYRKTVAYLRMTKFTVFFHSKQD